MWGQPPPAVQRPSLTGPQPVPTRSTNSPCHSLPPKVKRNPTVTGSRPRRGPEQQAGKTGKGTTSVVPQTSPHPTAASAAEGPTGLQKSDSQPCGPGKLPLILHSAKKSCHPEEAVLRLAPCGDSRPRLSSGPASPGAQPASAHHKFPLSFPPTQGKKGPDCEGVTATPWPRTSKRARTGRARLQSCHKPTTIQARLQPLVITAKTQKCKRQGIEDVIPPDVPFLRIWYRYQPGQYL
jgi:hypothetical protein